MKMIFIFLIGVISFRSHSQTGTPVRSASSQSSAIKSNSNTNNTTTGRSVDAGRAKSLRQNQMPPATSPNLRATKNPTSNPPSQATYGQASPFVGGIQASEHAANTFDTLGANNNENANRSNTVSATIPGGNDTTFNANTINGTGVTTNSGAVDRSGQAQFGQTNWGSSRGTIGESQWTIPPPITASFNKEFPAVNNATWTRNNVDTSIFSARYKRGASWVTTNYNTSGGRLDMRTEVPLPQPPAPISVFIAKQPSNFQVTSIYRVQVQGKPEVYEVKTKTGKTIYVNNEGMEVNY